VIPSTPREPPHSFEAEEALLGAILNNNAAYHRCSDIVNKAHFADPLHGEIWDAMSKLIDRGQQANVFALKSYLDAKPKEVLPSGSAYSAKLVASSVGAHDARQVARLLRNLYLRRQIITVSSEAVTVAYADDPKTTALEQIEILERQLYDLAATGQSDGGFKTFAKALDETAAMAEAAFKKDGQVVGVSTGFRDLDQILGGLHRSDLVILAGRPSMGKTALATNIAFNAAKAHRAEERDGVRVTVAGAMVGFFSLEMSCEQLSTRIVSEQAMIPSERIRRGEVSLQEFDTILTVMDELKALPLFIDDTGAPTIVSIRNRARRLKRQHGLDLIVVDYLQLITAPKDVEGRVNQVSEITRGLKSLAKELDVPVMALSQLSRAVEQREDKRPQLSDLRDSGSIEQDADVVAFIFRDEYYAQRGEPVRHEEENDQRFHERSNRWHERIDKGAGQAELLIQKQRHGPTGTVRLRFDAALTRFGDAHDG
jgi:replicative DNA helicase